MSRATRKLAATAYRAGDFRRRVLAEVYDRPERLVAPSYGFDVVPVLWHCRRARALLWLRDGAVCLLLVLAWLAGGLRPLEFTAFILACWGLIAVLALSVLEVAGVDRQVRAVLRGRALGVLAVLALAAALYLVLSADTRAALGISTLLADRSGFGLVEPDPAGRTVAGELASGPVLLITGLLAAVTVLHALMRYHAVKSIAAGRLRQPVGGRLAAVADQQRGNVTIYAGPRPFIGAGVNLRTWSFAQLLIPEAPPPGPRAGGGDFREPPLAAVDVVSTLRQRLGALAAGDRPETTLPGLLLEDRVFWGAEDSPGAIWSMSHRDLRQILAEPTNSAPTTSPAR